MPHVIIIAGSNGAGKSTAAPALLKDALPEATIKRRYIASLHNFFNLYSPLADSWQFYDNSNTKQLSHIASKISENKLFVENEAIWRQLLETFNEK